MTELSPVAQAVLDAANNENSYGPDDCLNESRWIVAAALRAAVDQLVPEHREHYPATLDERHRKVSAFDVRNKFLAIAAELEAQ
jgi:hypothetical protein